MADVLDRFLFENRSIRGEIVSLEESFQSILASADYPGFVQTLIGELLVTASLLAATLKFEGEIALQIQGEGPIKYIIVNGTHEQKLRGVARWDETIVQHPKSFSECFKKGILVITLTPKDGQRYQGMVALDKSSLADCVEDYFLQSEQLLTKVFLTSQLGVNPKAAGLLIQIVPTSSESSNVEENPDFEHVVHLANTVTSEEILTLQHSQMIHRLYHDEVIRIFEPQKVQFSCDCSRDRSAGALRSMPIDELLEIIVEDGNIKMDCQFCHSVYIFDEIDVKNIHSQNLGSGRA
ncbi:molecular chaperone Hsp33 [Glaciecola punicea]|jgi:molecular chaperone Hsp33|uniref:Hsp33 family molecular chaperone HslO n=1 Tax=Glaciecola punicea TaxID=56804 RepID=UPI000872ADB4|nr:Hsp33 family molecular chaperone HslO [Glaciecola punicea]OFA31868.1 molecular chaperone Hsp33 [Glaciecola punicea]